MYIRFGHPDLGHWEYDCGPMKMKRYVIRSKLDSQSVLSTVHVSLLPFTFRLLGEDHCEMIRTLQIDAELLRSKRRFSSTLHYKYTVFSPKAEKDEDCYEYLHDYYGITNRCLKIANEKYFQLVAHGGLIFFYIICLLIQNL